MPSRSKIICHMEVWGTLLVSAVAMKNLVKFQGSFLLAIVKAGTMPSCEDSSCEEERI